MEKIKTFDNLKRIILKSFEWRHRNLSDPDTIEVKFKFITKFNLVILISALLISLLITTISDDLINAILTFTSIFATLIIPVLILVYDKFSKDPNSHLSEVEKKSVEAIERFKLYKNFTNRYIFVTLENIILSVLIILLILIYKTFLCGYFHVCVLDYRFDSSFDPNSINIFLHILIEIFMKTLFSILLIKFVYFLFFSIGAIGDFFISVLEEK